MKRVIALTLLASALIFCQALLAQIMPNPALPPFHTPAASCPDRTTAQKDYAELMENVKRAIQDFEEKYNNSTATKEDFLRILNFLDQLSLQEAALVQKLAVTGASFQEGALPNYRYIQRLLGESGLRTPYENDLPRIIELIKRAIIARNLAALEAFKEYLQNASNRMVILELGSTYQLSSGSCPAPVWPLEDEDLPPTNFELVFLTNKIKIGGWEYSRVYTYPTERGNLNSLELAVFSYYLQLLYSVSAEQVREALESGELPRPDLSAAIAGLRRYGYEPYYEPFAEPETAEGILDDLANKENAVKTWNEATKSFMNDLEMEEVVVDDYLCYQYQDAWAIEYLKTNVFPESQYHFRVLLEHLERELGEREELLPNGQRLKIYIELPSGEKLTLLDLIASYFYYHPDKAEYFNRRYSQLRDESIAYNVDPQVVMDTFTKELFDFMRSKSGDPRLHEEVNRFLYSVGLVNFRQFAISVWTNRCPDAEVFEIAREVQELEQATTENEQVPQPQSEPNLTTTDDQNSNSKSSTFSGGPSHEQSY